MDSAIPAAKSNKRRRGPAAQAAEPSAPGSDAPAADPLDSFQEPVRSWFRASFRAPTRAQELAWPVIQRGESTLVLAPTGSGKTLAAFLVAIDRVMFDAVPPKDERCRVLYVSPLKALAVDVERNLRAPLVGVTRYAERMGRQIHEPTVSIRTGDTPQRERAQFNRTPSDILITTPESLYLLLTSAARESLRSIRWVIIDEIHALVGTKRGAHLSLSLERLQQLTGAPLQRIGLSATQRPLDEVARFLGGFQDPAASGPTTGAGIAQDEAKLFDQDVETLGQGLDSILGESFHDDSRRDGGEGTSGAGHGVGVGPGRSPAAPRPVHVVDAGRGKQLDLRVEVPVEDMAKIGQPQEIPSGPAAQGEVRTSIWPAIHPLILDLIRQHRSTLIFVNSRRLAERLAAALNELAGDEIVHAHHGSIAREQRLHIEDELKSGRLPAMVATSSLELGIDMGAIDLVIQVEAPPSVASGIQRIGRAGHQVGAASKGIIIPKYRGDILACAALTDRMVTGSVESTRYLRNPLDVLAQQIVAMVSMDGWRIEDLQRVVKRAAPFADLPQSMLEEVLDMLSGRYPSDEFAELRPRVTWDRLNGTLQSREGAKRIAITNGGTIPDRGLYGVFLVGAEKGHGRVGELDEEMVFESRVGDTFLLGATTWRIEEITHDRVMVSPAPGVPGKMPFWHGESPGRPLEFGRAIGALSRTLRELPRPQAESLLMGAHALTAGAARNLMQYLEDQVEAVGAVPDDRTIVVESYRDEMGDWRVCLLSPFGARVHAPWAMAIGAMVREQTDFEIDILWTDDGIVARFPEADEPPSIEAMLPDPDEVEDMVVRQLGSGGGGARESGQGAPVNALFASHFREAAARALLLPRRSPGRRSPLWQQRKRAAELLQVTSRFGSFPMVLETFRECLRDVFDMPALVELLREIRSRDIRVVPVQSRVPSPFAASLMFNYVANFIYEGDAPLAERRAQALSVDPAQLRELLGEVELRQLLDADALESLELYLQHLAPERLARHADGLHDLFLRLGDLSREEVIARVTSAADAEGWLDRLERDRRIVRLTIAGEPRFIAAEDTGRYRDALGIPPPQGLPDAFLEYVRDPLGDLVARYARTHGPFHLSDLAGRLGIGIAPVSAVLARMENSGRVVEGEFRPGGAGREWCDTGVLRALRQRSLARLRHEVEPVEQPALARLYAAWQQVEIAGTTPDQAVERAPRRRSRRSLVDVLEQLQGAAIPASVLESQVLASRIPGYDPRELDALTASGSVIWVGCESLGQHDGRISLYLTEHAPLLLPDHILDESSEPEASSPMRDRIRELLASRGASFFPQILQATGGYSQEVLETLWDLVWAGEVTNDTIHPLRAYLNPRSAGRTRRAGRAETSPPASTAGSDPRPRARGLLKRFPTSGYAQDGGAGSPRSGSTPRPPSTPRAIPAEASGRWSLVKSLVFGEATPTERLSARTHQLLDRYGILTREAVQAEGIEGGFSAIYGILRAMEEAGRVRRGYFVSGLGATQFAVPGAVDRLRALREPGEAIQGLVLAATDPANPYGAALSWPESSGGRRPMRMAGAIVILLDGVLAGWMGRGERQLLTFLEDIPDRDRGEAAFELARVLADQVGPGRRRALFVEEVDGKPARDTPIAAALIEAGFSHTVHGFLRRV